jgi:virulence-associated protein VapD
LSGSLYEQNLPQKTHDIYNEIKRLRNEGNTYDDISKHLKEKGWTTTQGKELYGTYIYTLKRRMEKRQKMLDRYKRTIENLRVEFHYDEEKENEKVEVKEKIKESKIE